MKTKHNFILVPSKKLYKRLNVFIMCYKSTVMERFKDGFIVIFERESAAKECDQTNKIHTFEVGEINFYIFP